MLTIEKDKAIMEKRVFKQAPGKKVKFMGETVEIFKLSTKQVIEVQKLAKEQNGDSDDAGLRMLEVVIKLGAPELVEFTSEELQEFPLDDLSALSASIMEYSGLSKAGKSN
jgi:hypothetical protein